MGIYISLLTFTQKGIENINQQAGRIESIRQRYRDAGGELIAYYPTMGQYDAIAIYRMADDAAAAAFVLATMSRGYVRSETLKAFEESEYRNIIEGLPEH